MDRDAQKIETLRKTAALLLAKQSLNPDQYR